MKWGGSPWLAAIDPKTGRTYYYQPGTHKTAWVNPNGGGAQDAPAAALAAHMGGFDCHAGLGNWQMGWSVQKMRWCCAHKRLGCLGQAMRATPKPLSPISRVIPPSDSSEGGGCPGAVVAPGIGQVSLVNAKWNMPGDPGGRVEVVDGAVVCHMKGRTYFSSSCTTGLYDHRRYAALTLLGKRMRYTVDLSGAECGCNAALYLTSMKQSERMSKCRDFYCDANSVCGESCAEVDIQEANKYAWFSTLHVHNDGGGMGAGYGNMRSDFNSSQYGPGAACIDTLRPFQVSTAFPVDAHGLLEAMEVTLTQPGKTCPLRASVGKYYYMGRNMMPEVTRALSAGMAPIISYWSAESMLWMDGKGIDGKGPCARDDASQCTDSVKFWGFSVQSIPTSM